MRRRPGLNEPRIPSLIHWYSRGSELRHAGAIPVSSPVRIENPNVANKTRLSMLMLSSRGMFTAVILLNSVTSQTAASNPSPPPKMPSNKLSVSV